jgi:hypothetical protein
MESVRNPLVLTSSALVVLAALYNNVWFAFVGALCLTVSVSHDLILTKITAKKMADFDELHGKIIATEQQLEHLKNSISLLSRRV